MLTRSERGSALLTVLWLTAALSAIGIAVASNVRSETERTATSVDEVRAYFAARGAIERTAMRAYWGRDYSPFGGRSVDVSFPEAEVHVEIIPETSKLSLNGIPPEVLLRLLLALGVPPEQAPEIAAAIIDWRKPLGAEGPSPFDAFYLAESPSFLPPHSSYLANEELLLVKGVTNDLYFGDSMSGRPGLRDCLSIYGSAGVDINTAQAATMIATGLSAEDAAGVIRRRAQQPFRIEEMPALQETLGPAGAQVGIRIGSILTLRATARLRTSDGKLSDMRRTVATLVKFYFSGNQQGLPAHYEVLNWYDRP
jgi:general secretion pathway protein K